MHQQTFRVPDQASRDSERLYESASNLHLLGATVSRSAYSMAEKLAGSCIEGNKAGLRLNIQTNLPQARQ